MKDIIILGPPGSGKGTQAKKIAQKLGMFYFGTGDLLREEKQKKTAIGEEFQEILEKKEGGLVPDEFINKFVQEKLNTVDTNKEIVFDGFPRTIQQAEILDAYFKNKNKNYQVLNIQVSTKSIINRMETRRICEKCDKIFFRPDETGIRQCDVCGGDLIQRQEDKPDTIRKRIAVYQQRTEPLIDYYKGKGKLVSIDGNPSIEEVDKNIWEKINGN